LRSNPTDAEGLRFGGWIDEPAIFNDGLSAADINAIYNAAQVAPVITRRRSRPPALCEGFTVEFSVWAEGSPVLAYQW
jgi:hypothetical protein